ncbi:MAG: PEP/pyruvate-binding domain-containing protein [Deltaproteobacteria bacterium]|nr:PEP/pyruvate-binding domain-containing protein [Deltaproteobacteria bacterium]
MTNKQIDPKAAQEFIEGLFDRHPHLKERICQALLIALHQRAIVSINDIHARAHRHVAQARPDDNAPLGRKWDREEKQSIQQLTIEHATQAFSVEEIDDMFNMIRKRLRAQSLEEIAELPQVSFGVLRDKLMRFCRLPEGQTTLSIRESMAARVGLIRNFVSEQLEFIGVARHHMRIRDFESLVARIMGDDEGRGLIGGKAGGMVLGATILRDERKKNPKAPGPAMRTPESWFLRSDMIEQFLAFNDLKQFHNQKYKDIEDVASDYPMLLELFRNAQFPPDMEQSLRAMLEEIGEHPLVVRSSSLLEDRFQTAFAGKYRSVFVANHGPIEKRLDELMTAVAEVYASTLHPDPISYRQRHQLIDYQEHMAVLIQKMVGQRVGRYFLPTWAGVAFSQNPYRRNPRIRPEDGMARVVFGLGTRAVDRVSSDFPRMLALGMPALRPEVHTNDVIRVGQKQVDVIDLEMERFARVSVEKVLAEQKRIPHLNLIFSGIEHGDLKPIMGDGLLSIPDELAVTFDTFAAKSPYPAGLRWTLQTLEKAYGCPVDIEFAHDGEDFYLLQCRPQATRRPEPEVEVPTDIPDERCVFYTERDVVASGRVDGIEAIVLIDPIDYNRLQTTDQRRAVAEVVRRLNLRLGDRPFILMGPGRWGSKDAQLGVPVTYADINNARMLIEIAREQGGYMPEVSFGSHFFQDLVETDIHYLALYPDLESERFCERILHGSHNSLGQVVPEFAHMKDTVRLIDVPDATQGMHLRVDMDANLGHALGYLVPPPKGDGG